MSRVLMLVSIKKTITITMPRIVAYIVVSRPLHKRQSHRFLSNLIFHFGAVPYAVDALCRRSVLVNIGVYLRLT